MNPNVLREYFALSLIGTEYNLTRMGSFENPGQAISCARNCFSDGLFTVLSAESVGKMHGIVSFAQIVLPQMTAEANSLPVFWVWKFLDADMLIGVVNFEFNLIYRDAGMKPNPLNEIPEQERIEFTIPQALALMKTIGVAMM